MRDLIDFDEPLGLLLVAMLQFVPDREISELIAQYRDALPRGSHLVMSHPTQDVRPGQAERVTAVYRREGIPCTPRSKAEIERAFEGFELLEPGVVQTPLWRPDGPVTPDLDRIWMYGSVGRKL